MNVIVKSRRYVLGETDEHFAIWDALAGGGPIETFPLTAEGFDEAEARFSDLKREDRKQRTIAPPLLLGAIGVGVVLWILGGVVAAIMGSGALLGTDLGIDAFYVVQAVDLFGHRVAIGSLFLLIGYLMLRWSRVSTERSPLAGVPDPVHGPPSTFDRVLRWSFGLGIALWVVVGLVSQILTPRELGSPPFTPPAAGLFFSAVLEGLAFRVWVAALIVLVLRWAQRRWSFAARPSSEGDPS